VLFPQRLMGAVKPVVLWGDLTLWGGVLIVTAYVISTLRTTAKEAMLDLNRSYEGVLAILSKFIQIVDTDTASHSVRVSNWCVRIAKRMQLKGNVVEQCRVAGLLHDVGKAEVSTALLHKAASLSTGEKKDVSQHVDCGAALLHPIGGMLEAIAAAVENHHEKWDGSGYKGLKGEEIPLVARIVAVADAVDAIMSDRPYRKGASSFQAMDIVISSAGSHFDPQVVEAMKMAVRADEEPVAASDSPMADQAMSATGYGL
jgi:putative nucleotidyltransferase with HDIG domain